MIDYLDVVGSKKRDKNFNICLAFDYKFKKMFGDENGIERLESLISVYFDIPYEEVKGKIKLLNNEKKQNFKEEKRSVSDVYLRLELISGNVRIDLEVSNKKLSQSIIDKNVLYGSYYLTHQLKGKQSYSDLEKTIVINFDRGLTKIDEEKIRTTYMLRSEEGILLTDKLQIEHVNIDICEKIWYSKDIEKYEEKNIIMLGALLSINKVDDFEECLGGIPMSEKIKEDISDVNDALNEEEDIMYWYDYDEDRRKIEESEKADALKEEKKSTAKNLKKLGVDINIISQATGLSKEEIEKI